VMTTRLTKKLTHNSKDPAGPVKARADWLRHNKANTTTVCGGVNVAWRLSSDADNCTMVV
jgi:hypothetical protein